MADELAVKAAVSTSRGNTDDGGISNLGPKEDVRRVDRTPENENHMPGSHWSNRGQSDTVHSGLIAQY